MENTDTSFMVTGVIPDTPVCGYAVCSMPEFLLVRREDFGYDV